MIGVALGLLGPLPETNPRAAAVLVDEFDPCAL
jgi:hypothetical protein